MADPAIGVPVFIMEGHELIQLAEEFIDRQGLAQERNDLFFDVMLLLF